MDEELKQFQEQNGTVNYTTKELVQGLHSKIDNSFEKLDKKIDVTIKARERNSTAIASLKTWRLTHSLIITGYFMIFGYIIFTGG